MTRTVYAMHPSFLHVSHQASDHRKDEGAGAQATADATPTADGTPTELGGASKEDPHGFRSHRGRVLLPDQQHFTATTHHFA